MAIFIKHPISVWLENIYGKIAFIWEVELGWFVLKYIHTYVRTYEYIWRRCLFQTYCVFHICKSIQLLFSDQPSSTYLLICCFALQMSSCVCLWGHTVFSAMKYRTKGKSVIGNTLVSDSIQLYNSQPIKMKQYIRYWKSKMKLLSWHFSSTSIILFSVSDRVSVFCLKISLFYVDLIFSIFCIAFFHQSKAFNKIVSKTVFWGCNL